MVSDNQIIDEIMSTMMLERGMLNKWQLHKM